MRVTTQLCVLCLQDELAKSVTTEQGKTFQDAKGDVFRGLGKFGGNLQQAAQHSAARHSTVSTVQCSTVQHSAAQLCTAQHSAAPNNEADVLGTACFCKTAQQIVSTREVW
jgi:hypothetical protein